MKSTDKKLTALRRASLKMVGLYRPGSGWYSGADAKGPTFNNWDGAFRDLCRRVQVGQAELTLLSCSLGFGPTPDLDGEQRKKVFLLLFPEGERKGLPAAPAAVMNALRIVLTGEL